MHPTLSDTATVGMAHDTIIDAMHNALGLSRTANDIVLAGSGLLLLKSGHALRVTHLRHHGRCLDASFAGTMSRARTPVVNSFAYHHPHHRHRRVPTALLPSLARAVGPDVAFDEGDEAADVAL